MTFQDAIRKASARARSSEEERFVIIDEYDDYVVVNDNDLDTFYVGCEVVATVEPDGNVIVGNPIEYPV